MDRELLLLALGLHGAAGLVALSTTFGRQRRDRLYLGLAATALLAHALAIVLRWERVGHGPFVTQYEALSSNLFSLQALYLLSWLRLPAVRPLAGTIQPVLLVLAAWIPTTRQGDGNLPATYETLWLWAHLVSGKLFLGAVLVALSLAAGLLLRVALPRRPQLAALPPNADIDELCWRFMKLAFVFDTAMLLSGAVWAQNAWGRFWDWDPLEVWSLLTWLIIAAGIHLRLLGSRYPRLSALVVVLIFVVAFVTFFGVPFVSTSQHKGMV